MDGDATVCRSQFCRLSITSERIVSNGGIEQMVFVARMPRV